MRLKSIKIVYLHYIHYTMNPTHILTDMENNNGQIYLVSNRTHGYSTILPLAEANFISFLEELYNIIEVDDYDIRHKYLSETNLKNKIIIVTGGAGYFGKLFTKQTHYPLLSILLILQFARIFPTLMTPVLVKARLSAFSRMFLLLLLPLLMALLSQFLRLLMLPTLPKMQLLRTIHLMIFLYI